MESAEGSNSVARRRSASERKSVDRRSRSDRRKSGPKSVDLETNRQEGKEGRRRMSGTHRRDSRNKATAKRRERSELRPPLGAHPGIGRASLPARLSAPGVVPPAPPADEIEVDTEIDEVQQADGGGVEAMQQDKPEGEGEGEKVEEDARWTPEMVEEAARGILGEDRQLQLRCGRMDGTAARCGVGNACLLEHRKHTARNQQELCLQNTIDISNLKLVRDCRGLCAWYVISDCCVAYPTPPPMRLP